MSLSSFPLLYFFVFLYYTDVGSTFFILMAYLFCLRGNHLMAAIFAADAIFFRQTNIVWVVFMAGTTLAKQIDLEDKEGPPQSKTIIEAVISAVQRGLKYITSLTNIFRLLLLKFP